MLIPRDTQDLVSVVSDAINRNQPLEIRGGGALADIGRPDRVTQIVQMSNFSGVVDYDPEELTVTVAACTRVSEIQSLLAAHGQMLAFEPCDYAPLFGKAAGAASIGGIVAANIAGSRRVACGAPRDYLLGFEAVSGRGIPFKAGGKVVKNVTGFDLSKLVAGSWGQIAVLTTMTLKVLPQPEHAASIAVLGLSDDAACGVMSRMLGSSLMITGAAHLPKGITGIARETSATVFRVEGFKASVEDVMPRFQLQLESEGRLEQIPSHDSAALWGALSAVRPMLAQDTVLWRISGPPRQGCRIVEMLSDIEHRHYYDWAGARLWLETPASAPPSRVRAAAEKIGGEATLVRAPASIRNNEPILPPQARLVREIALRVKAEFDPAMILDPARFMTPAGV